ncbi:hypothetical protein [Streptosporangium roseum]|uniref:hypothetical protein n=1 Tax=Streptosporangium roseum TaxID=2001 RepID=UPI0004CD19B6|nr:hypothetical protein [Streptosporangium roseum]
MTASMWALLEDAGLTSDEWELVEGLVTGNRGEGQLLLFLLTKAHTADGVAEARSALQRSNLGAPYFAECGGVCLSTHLGRRDPTSRNRMSAEQNGPGTIRNSWTGSVRGS